MATTIRWSKRPCIPRVNRWFDRHSVVRRERIEGGCARDWNLWARRSYRIIRRRIQDQSAMETYYNSNENIGLQLSGAMTFFFSSVYLQFHVNRIAKWKSNWNPE